MKKEGNLNWVKQCGAKTKRTGEPCPQPAMANGRCRMHGGKTPSGKASVHYKHGYYTKEAMIQRKMLRELLRLLKQESLQ